MSISYGLAAGVGAVVGIVGGSAYCIHRVMHRDGGVSSVRELTYSDLIAFADKCKSQISTVVKCRVACELLDNGTYRVTQLMLNNQAVAIRSDAGDVVGRIVICKEIDDKIRVLCGNNFPSDFDFGV